MTCIIIIRDKILYHESFCLSCTWILFLLECHIWKESHSPKINNRISIIHNLAKNIFIMGSCTTKIIKHDRWRQKSWSTLFKAITVVYSTSSHHLNYNKVLLKTGCLGTNFIESCTPMQIFSFEIMLSAKWRPFCSGLNISTPKTESLRVPDITLIFRNDLATGI